LRKARIIITVLLVILLGISIGLSIKLNADRDKARRYLLNSVNACFVNISVELDKVISGVENGTTTFNYNRDTLLRIADYLYKADTLLTQYHYSRPSAGLKYTAVYNFGYIASTMGFGSGTANNIRYDCILYDAEISDNEIRYLETLRDDITLHLNGMQSAESQNENPNLTITQLNNILSGFFDTWSYYNENSPYLLLRSE